VVLLAVVQLRAQEAPAPLEYTGKPLQIRFQCSNEDIHLAGLSCSEEEPCPLYLELVAVEAVGNKVFLAGNLHSSTSTLYSILLASEDSGRTWREPFERLRGCGLDHIQFIDFENGWVSGQSLRPLPQDPFLLMTNDGGKSWRRRPVSSESRAGTILEFWFSSRSNGSLVIDRGQGGELGRYELYESPNAGETWMMREANEKPIRLKRTAAANPDWRIRADAATKAFRVERRQGERWTTLVAFSIPVGNCKPEEQPEPSPPQMPVEAPSAPPAAPARPPTLKRPGR